MPHEKSDDGTSRIVQLLSDARQLRDSGVGEPWIHKCEDLVSEYRRLELRFRQLEADISASEPQSSDDTIVL